MKNDENNDNIIQVNNNINKKNIVLFEENLEYIDLSEIDQLINKVNQRSLNSSSDKSNLTQQSVFLQKNENNFPYYIGSFKHSLNKLLRSKKNKDLYELYEKIIHEIKKVYYGYTHVEQKMYAQMNKYIKFKDAENTTPLEIISKLKEISETLKETVEFVEKYLYINFSYLKIIFQKTDEKIRQKIDVKSISLYFLLDIFDLPNNELSYMMMFKVIDEISCILKHITDQLDVKIQNLNKMGGNQIKNIINTNEGNQSNLLDNSANPSVALNAMIKLKNKYIKNIYELLTKLDEYDNFRAKYYNKYLYTRGNYQIDTNKYSNESDLLSENSESFLQINSLMDEELIISRFLDRSLINEFLDFFETQLSTSFKRNRRLIYLHSIQNNIISIFAIYSFYNYYNGFIEICLYFIGRIIGKSLYNCIIKKRRKMKFLLLLLSNLFLFPSLILKIIGHNQIYYGFISNFLFGLSYCKNIETRFILNYIPKFLIKRNIKKYFRIKYFSFGIGFLLLSGFTYLQDFIDNNLIRIDMISLGVISLIILILNILLFKEPKVDDVIEYEMENLGNKKLIEDKEIEVEDNNINISTDSKLNTSEKVINISYGKAKLISLKERNKVKLMENALKLGAGKGNYEGINHIFSILQDLILKENLLYSSYTNFSAIGHILFLTILYIIFSIIIFYNPLINAAKTEIDENNEKEINDFKKRIWTFGVSYLLCYLMFKFKCFSKQKKLSSWNFILLLFIIFQIFFVLLFLITEPDFVFDSPIILDNYYYYMAFYSVVLFFISIIEKVCTKIMIREIPLEANFCKINIDNFLDFHENFTKAFIFFVFFAIIYFKVIKYDFIYKIVIITLFSLGLIVFLLFNYKRKQFSLIKIINKVTYESF